MQRASVVLPEPDSPTTATHEVRGHARGSTSDSTVLVAVARVQARDVEERRALRPCPRPLAVGGELLTPVETRTSSCARMQRDLCGRRRRGHHGGGAAAHSRIGVAAPRREEAPGRPASGARRLALHAHERVADLGRRDGPEEPWCRGGRARRTHPRGAELDDAAGVHDRHAVGDLGDDGEVVGHVDGRDAVRAAQPLTVSRTWRWVATSRPVVGSSRTMSSGRQENAMARAMRCCWPPESWWG